MRGPWTLAKLGKLDNPCLHAKGAESRTLVKFCAQIVDLYKEKLGREGALLAAAGYALVEYNEILKNEHRLVPVDVQLRLMECIINHNCMYRAAGGRMVPKHHMAIHLSNSCSFAGNPSFFNTYEDESENGVVARIGEVVHFATWCMSVWERVEVLERGYHGT